MYSEEKKSVMQLIEEHADIFITIMNNECSQVKLIIVLKLKMKYQFTLHHTDVQYKRSSKMQKDLTKRKKWGLVNGLGISVKTPFGNSDAKDGARCDKIVSHMEQI